MKIQKITEPKWLGILGPKINEYSTKYLKDLHISYEALFSYYSMSIQLGRREKGIPDTSEFWVVFNEGKPRAFAHWGIRLLPHIGKVYMDSIYSWAKTPKATSMLLDEFIEFGKRHRCTTIEGEVMSEKVFNIFVKHLDGKGYDLNNVGSIHCIGRKRRT